MSSTLIRDFRVQADEVAYEESCIKSSYTYHAMPEVVLEAGQPAHVIPKSTVYEFLTSTKVPKTGLMIVGWGGNNGSTLTAAIVANQQNLKWRKRSAEYSANYYGSITQASTIRLGVTAEGKEVYVPFGSMIPMVHPNDLVLGGWDISSLNIAESMRRADVLDADLQRQLYPLLEGLQPLPSCFDSSFVAANQGERADHIIPGTKAEALEQIRKDIREFKAKNGLDKIVIVWSANTERFADIIEGVNDTADNLLAAIASNHSEIAPSTIFAIAALQEGCPFVNGSPQNTHVPGLVDLVERHGVFSGGADFKSGQTKIKSVLVDFLVSAGIKPLAITSYNHLGNNDGMNLSAPQQFRSKEISKSDVVNDMVESNGLLYKPGEHPDHTVVIKYVPTVGDSKRAMDEYVSEIFMGGTNTIALHNTCEDSLLASPIILDLCILAELFERIKWRMRGEADYLSMHPILSLLSYLVKAPLVPSGTPVVNALFRQRAALENTLRACVGLQPENHMLLEQKLFGGNREADRHQRRSDAESKQMAGEA